jgi:hypothetical protein
MQDLDRDHLLGEIRSKRSDPCFHPVGRRRVVRANMRGGGDNRDALACSPTGELAAVLERSSAIVDAWQYVRMEIDHSGRIGLR